MNSDTIKKKIAALKDDLLRAQHQTFSVEAREREIEAEIDALEWMLNSGELKATLHRYSDNQLRGEQIWFFVSNSGQKISPDFSTRDAAVEWAELGQQETFDARFNPSTSQLKKLAEGCAEFLANADEDDLDNFVDDESETSQ